jgi:hypothetical protein
VRNGWFESNPAALGFRGAFDDRQTQTAAGLPQLVRGCAPVERLEHRFGLVFRDARAVVFDYEFEHRAALVLDESG